MSRVAKKPIEVPTGVEIKITSDEITVKGKLGTMTHQVHPKVELVQQDNVISVKAVNDEIDSIALAGTTRALVNNMVIGVSTGFEKKLELRGIGYRANAQGNKLVLELGFSHPVDYQLPEGVSAQCPSQTEIVLTGYNKQVLSQAAAEIREFRPPEPYKGKGVRYLGERIRMKEAKKA